MNYSRYMGTATVSPPRPRIGSRRTPLILTCNCSQCRLATQLTVVDADRITPAEALGAQWDCPNCHADNRLPALGVVTSVVRL